jgi:predicted nucleic acid-binding Zn ribbon protein
MNMPSSRPALKSGAGSRSRRQALTQWRGIDLAPLERAAKDTARSAGSLVPTIVQSLGLDRKRAEAEILKVWNNLIDPNITAHAQPTGLNKGTLFVTVDSSPWLDEIVRYRRREILDRLQHSFGKDVVVKISFRTG